MAKQFWVSCQTSSGESVLFHSPTYIPDGIDGFGRILSDRQGVIVLPDDDAAIEVYRWMIDLGWEYHPLMTGPVFTFMKLLATRGLR